MVSCDCTWLSNKPREWGQIRENGGRHATSIEGYLCGRAIVAADKGRNDGLVWWAMKKNRHM